MLTTHYIKLCNLIKEENRISNMYMDIIDNKNTYKIRYGISYEKGGIKVLKDLDYNEEIIINASQIIEKIDI